MEAQVKEGDKQKLMEPETQEAKFKKREVAESYIRLYPKVPNKTLARLLCKVEPTIFFDIEQARSSIRSIRGANGQFNGSYSVTDLQRTDEESEECRNNSFGIPPTDAKAWIPYLFPMRKARGLALFDTHVPYHSPDMIAMAVKYARTMKFLDFIILGGDIQDWYKISKFTYDPRKRDATDEVSITKQFLASLTMLKEKPFIIFKAGNHDDRLLLYQRRVCPQLCGQAEFNIENLLRLRELDIQYVGDSRPIQFGHLDILHGHEFSKGNISPINPARTAFLKAKRCVLVGHSHVATCHKGKDSRGKVIASWSVACCCELTPEYARLNEWTNGFALLEKNGDDFEVSNMQIINNQILHA
jgi:predicted phosphodiesterase